MPTGHASPLMATEVYSLFPTFVWKARFEKEACEPINGAILALLARMRADKG